MVGRSQSEEDQDNRSWNQKIKDWINRHIVFLVVGFLVLLMLALSLIKQADLALDESRFSKEALFWGPIVSGEISFVGRISYPAKLLVETIDKTRRPLILQIQIFDPELVKNTYIRIESSNVMLIDADGKSISTDIEIQKSGVFIFYLTPSNTAIESPASIQLFMSQDRGEHWDLVQDPKVNNLIIPIESPTASWQRFLLERFTQDMALPLGLASIIIGLAIDYSKRQAEREDKKESLFRQQKEKEDDLHRQQEEKERNQLIDNLQTTFDQDLPAGIEEFEKLMRRVSSEKWSNDLSLRLDNISRNLERDENKLRLIQYLNAVCLSSPTKLQESLKDLPDFYSKSGKNVEFGKLLLEVEKAILGDASYDEAVQTALRLWEEYDRDAIELVKRTVLIGRKPGREALLAKTKNQFRIRKQKEKEPEKKKNNQRLLRYEDLKPLAEDIKSHPAYDYNWNQVDSSWDVDVSNSSIGRWVKLSKSGLIRNPFQAWSGSRFDISTWALPDQWDEIASPMLTLVHTRNSKDLQACAYMLEAWMQGEAHSNEKTFIVAADLISSANTSSEQISLALAHAAAEKWLHFLPGNPDAFLDLAREPSLQLAALLAWHTGSKSSLFSRFGAHGETTSLSKERKRMIARLDSLLFVSPQENPSIEWMLDSLAITPPGYKGTFAILLANQPELTEPLIQVIDTVSMKLLRTGIIPKPFLCSHSSIETPDSFSVIALSWDQESLKKFLSDRIKQSRGGENIEALFLPHDTESAQEVEKTLIEKSQGSLIRLLSLGNQFILEHIRLHPGEFHLDPEALKAILE